MPVIRTSNTPLNRNSRPEGCDKTAAGVFRVSTTDGKFDCHFHDCDEYWLIFKGKAKISSEGKKYYVKPGDIVYTRAGDEHDVLEIYEALEAFYFEDATPEGGRVGHLHKSEEKAQRHAVSAMPLPADFPAK